MRKSHLAPLALAAGLLLPTVAPAAPPPPAVPANPTSAAPPAAQDQEAAAAEADARLAALLKALRWQQGEITLRDGLAKLSVPAGFRFLGPEDSATVLTKVWGNPPQSERPLGMIFPADLGPEQDDSWAVVVRYEESGYVKDADADKINYQDLLKTMQEDTRKESERRVAEGYPAVELVGWAAPPRYDKAASKLYWAKELRLTRDGENAATLNYNIRSLGRRGVLVLNAIAGMDRLADIERATPQILAMVNFEQGHRYVDFDPKTDKTAAYGLAALVAGGVAAKAGLFKGLWIALLAFKKFIIIGVLALAGFVKSLFGGGGKSREQG